MIDLILQIIGFACLAHLTVDFISHLDTQLPEKPFKCDMCMGYWISIVPFFIQFGIYAILYSAITGVLANYIYKSTL